jgi:hypothetical protein
MYYSTNLQHRALVPPGVPKDILQGTRKHLTLLKTKYRDLLNLEPALILALKDSSLN